MKATLVLKGGSGSGHFGHAGRPGHVGGSSSSNFQAGRATTIPEGLARWGEHVLLQDEKANNHLNNKITQWNDAVASQWNPHTTKWENASHDTRAGVKEDIIGTISNLAQVPDDQVNDAIGQWANSSNGGDMRSLSLQQAASEELGLPLSQWQKDAISKNQQYAQESVAEMNKKTEPPPIIYGTEERYASWGDWWLSQTGDGERSRPLMPRDQERATIRAMYESTQMQLQSAGFQPSDTITLYRGFTTETRLNAGEQVDYIGNTMESWSVDPGIALRFAQEWDKDGAVVAMDVPVRNIISTARTGFGCLVEGEFVVAGSVPGNRATVVMSGRTERVNGILSFTSLGEFQED